MEVVVTVTYKLIAVAVAIPHIPLQKEKIVRTLLFIQSNQNTKGSVSSFVFC